MASTWAPTSKIPPANSTQDNYLYGKKLFGALITLNLANAVSFADILAATVILPAVAKHFGGSENTDFAPPAQLIGAAVGQCLLGYFSDIWSRRNMLLVALSILIISNIMCGVSGYTTAPVLFVAFRALSGVGSGSISNLVNIAQNDISPERRRLKMQGVQGFSVAIGCIYGTLVGAALLQAHEWQLYYFVLAGLAIAAWTATFLFVPSNVNTKQTKIKDALCTIDWFGILFGSVAITCALLLLCKYDRFSAAAKMGLGVATAVCLIAFFILGSINLLGVRPIMPFRLFRNRTIATIVFQNIIVGAVFYSFVFFIPITLQIVRQMRALKAVATNVPYYLTHGLWTTLSSLIISWLQKKGYRSYSIIFYFGYACWTVGMAVLAYDSQKKLGNGFGVIGITILVALGTGSVLQNSVMAITSQAATEDKAIALSIRNVLRFFGGALGTAIASAIVKVTLKDKLPDELIKLSHDAVFELAENSLIGSNHFLVEDAYAVAISRVFYVAAAGLGGCFLSTFLVQDNVQKIDGDVESATSSGTVTSTPDEGNTNENGPMAERSWL